MSEVSTRCTLWQLRLGDGQTYGLTDHDRPLVITDVTYSPQASFTASAAEHQTGFDSDSGTLQTVFDVVGLDAQSIADGVLDDARLVQFSYDWQSGEAPARLSEGRISDVRAQGDGFEAEWLGLASLLDRSHGRVFSRQCDASFCDSRCGLNRADYPTETDCPRSFTACRDIFANTENFRGFPYLLGDDALQAGPIDTDLRDGSSRYRL